MDEKNTMNEAQTVPSEPLVKPIVQKQTPLLIILGLVIIILLGSTGFLTYQNMQLQKQIAGMKILASPNPTSNNGTQTYTNTLYGFTFSYPSDFYIYPSSSSIISPAIVPQQWNQLSESQKFATASINIVKMENTNLDLQSLVKSFLIPGFGNVRNIKNLEVGNVQAVQFNSDNTQLGQTNNLETVLITPSKTTLIIELSPNNTNHTTDVYNQILSTFQFTTPTSQTDTSNWKTYTGQNFSFKYPNNWQNLTDGQGTDTALGFSVGNYPAAAYLTISMSKSIDLSSLKICGTNYPCLDAQAVTLTLGSKNALKGDVRYAVTDADFQIVQTTGSPFVQLKMNVSGGGLTTTFDQILSTFQFTQ